MFHKMPHSRATHGHGMLPSDACHRYLPLHHKFVPCDAWKGWNIGFFVSLWNACTFVIVCGCVLPSITTFWDSGGGPLHCGAWDFARGCRKILFFPTILHVQFYETASISLSLMRLTLAVLCMRMFGSCFCRIPSMKKLVFSGFITKVCMQNHSRTER